MSRDHSDRRPTLPSASSDGVPPDVLQRLASGGPSVGRRPLGAAALRALATIFVFATPIQPGVAQSPTLRGCTLTEEEFRELIGDDEATFRSSMVFVMDDGTLVSDTSGDPRLDAAFGQLLADLATRVQVRPGFGFFDDRGSPNAFATTYTLMPNTQGTVVIGTTLMNDYLRNPEFRQHGDLLLMAVCAHEFGHIKQYFHQPNLGLYDRLVSMHPTVKFLELHADFLSGYYMGTRGSQFSDEQLVVIGRGYEAMGDIYYNDPNHHGTNAERIAAIENGYLMGSLTGGGIDDAIEAGLYYLRA